MQLADVVREQGLGAWWREARALVRTGRISWKGALDNGLGPFVPFYARVRPLLGRASPGSAAVQLLAEPWRLEMRRRLDARGWDGVPPRSSFAERVLLIQDVDPGNFRKASLARWGVDERDPTADRRLIEFCLSLPTDLLLSNGRPRPLARAALADRLPAELLDSRVRGYQTADWHECFSPSVVAPVLEAGCRSGLLDRATIRAMLDSWPVTDMAGPEVIADYRMGLLRAATAASFERSFSNAASVSAPAAPAKHQPSLECVVEPQ